MCTGRKVRGFGLVEVMVSLLVIVLGALGMAGLHSRSVQYSQVAYLHSQGVILATDMLDRIRLNREVALTTNHYLVAPSISTTDSCIADEYPAQCEESQCTPEQLAEFDIKQWQFQIFCQLPNASGEITYDPVSSGRIYEIKLLFDSAEGTVNPGDIVLRGAI